VKFDSVKLFGSFQKVEEQNDGTLKVFGIASSEAVDSQGEIVKASAIKAAMPDYLKFGAVREMHSNIAAGTAIEMSVEDDGKTSFAALIVDPIAVKKVQTGVYKGFSIGGKVTGRDSINKKVITGLNLTEISLVDRPANPDACFSIYKADGVITADTAAAPVPDPANATPAAPNATKEAAAATEVPVAVADATGEPVQIKKGLYTLSTLASVLEAVASMAIGTQYEADYEKDGSPVPASLRSWLADGLKILNAMTVEESAELLAAVTPDEEVIVIALADKLVPSSDLNSLVKAGARHSKGDQAHLQGVHDSSVALGANCSSEKAAGSEDLAKAALQDTTEQLTKVTTQRDELLTKVTALEAQPAPPKGVQKVVGKESDSVITDKKKDEVEDNSPLALMKKAQATPQFMKL
jgi:hypothetical protein